MFLWSLIARFRQPRHLKLKVYSVRSTPTMATIPDYFVPCAKNTSQLEDKVSSPNVRPMLVQRATSAFEKRMLSYCHSQQVRQPLISMTFSGGCSAVSTGISA